MATILAEVIGAIMTALGFDGTDFRALLVDVTGQLIVVAGYYDGAYYPLTVDSDGCLLCDCIGAV